LSYERVCVIHVTLSTRIERVVTRTEAAAATRGALVRAASELLDEGGPDAVTLRAVGARAGVSRGAPYGHFDSKERLLAELAIDAWRSLADDVERLRAGRDTRPEVRLEHALSALVGVSRRQPHLYALMFSTPASEPAAIEASSRLHDQFLAVVADVVGEPDAPRYGALLMSSAHGIAGLESSGHLDKEAWAVDGDELVRMLVDAVRPRETPAPRGAGAAASS
jgi:AcrR family transcriptional regulator